MKGFTQKGFMQYLENKKPNQIAGYAEDCTQCGLAMFILDTQTPTHGDIAVEVEVSDHITVDYYDPKDDCEITKHETIKLPLWARNFIYLFDNDETFGKRPENGAIKVAKARKLLKIAIQYARRKINLFEESSYYSPEFELDGTESLRKEFKDKEKEWSKMEVL